jgi:hypothetical protein
MSHELLVNSSKVGGSNLVSSNVQLVSSESSAGNKTERKVPCPHTHTHTHTHTCVQLSMPEHERTHFSRSQIFDRTIALLC